jgi:tRNA 2-thiocytidine biosynthesis protein TtcA
MTTKRTFPPQVQRVFRWLGKAIDQFQMIEDGDRIVVGVSGADSLCLLWALRERLQWIPVSYELKALYIDMGFEGEIGEHLEAYLRKEGFDYEIIRTDIGIAAHQPGNAQNPCFICSRARRQRLFTFARDHQCSTIALGHHLEDINTTLFINILYGGSISTMQPRQDFFGGKLSVIRPFALVSKEQIERVAGSLGLPSLVNPCPSSQTSERKQINDLLAQFYRKDRRIRYNIFHAMRHIHRDYLPR